MTHQVVLPQRKPWFSTSHFSSVSFPAVIVFKFSVLHLIYCFCFKERERAKIHFHGAEEDDGGLTWELKLPKFCLGSKAKHLLR